MSTDSPSDIFARNEQKRKLEDDYYRMCPICSECERAMVIRDGRFGEFWGCPGFPKCKSKASITPEFIAKREEARKLGFRGPPFF
jgi:ssDNA-binding Zn-finger/Zn-ribbon topoisomerase 1